MIENYVGIPYQTMNCADLALVVQRDFFFKEYMDYKKPKSKTCWGLSQAIEENLFDYMDVEIKKPENGCMVLMKCKNRISHIGTFFKIENEDYVLHTSESFKSSILTKLNRLEMIGIEVQGYYRWK